MLSRNAKGMRAINDSPASAPTPLALRRNENVAFATA
jgi:hypothetical protein